MSASIPSFDPELKTLSHPTTMNVPSVRSDTALWKHDKPHCFLGDEVNQMHAHPPQSQWGPAHVPAISQHSGRQISSHTFPDTSFEYPIGEAPQTISPTERPEAMRPSRRSTSHLLKRKGPLPDEATKILFDTAQENPRPSRKDRILLQRRTYLDDKQISTWFERYRKKNRISPTPFSGEGPASNLDHGGDLNHGSDLNHGRDLTHGNDSTNTSAAPAPLQVQGLSPAQYWNALATLSSSATFGKMEVDLSKHHQMVLLCKDHPLKIVIQGSVIKLSCELCRSHVSQRHISFLLEAKGISITQLPPKKNNPHADHASTTAPLQSYQG